MPFKSQSTGNPVIDNAVACGQVGIYVFPCRWTFDAATGKKTNERFHEWWKGAQQQPDPKRLGGVVIRKAFAQGGPWNAYGIDLGASGLVGIDLDGYEAQQRFLELCLEHGRNPVRDGAHVKATPRPGGVHLIFQADPDHPIGNGAGVIGPNIDHRGVGGLLYGTGSYDERGSYTGPPMTAPHALPMIYPWLAELANGGKRVRTARPEAAGEAGTGDDDDVFDLPARGEEVWADDQARAYILRRLNELARQPRDTLNHALLDVTCDLYRFVPVFMKHEKLYAALIKAQERAWILSGGPDDRDYRKAKKTIDHALRDYVPGKPKCVRLAEAREPQGEGGSGNGRAREDRDSGEDEDERELPPWRRYAVSEADRSPFAFDGTPAGHLPEQFWAARPAHAHVRAVAHARMRGGTVALYALLARLSASLDPLIKVDTGIGKPLPLITYVAVVDPSGSGKTTGTDAAIEVLPAPDNGRIENDKGLTISTGQGMIESFYGEVCRDEVTEIPTETGKYDDGSAWAGPAGEDEDAWDGTDQAPPPVVMVKSGRVKKERGQVRYNRLFFCDEGGALIKQCQTPTSITADVLKELWTGDPTGQANADAERRRRIENYTLGLVAGFQSGKIDTVSGLLADTTGTLQRFLFCAARDNSLPRQPAPVDDPVLSHLLPMLDVSPSWPGMMFLPDDAATEIREHAWHRAQGACSGDDPVDAHWPVHVARLSALLALLSGETKIQMEDWNLAKLVWETSVRYRNHLIEERGGYAEAERQTKIRHAAETTKATTAAALAEQERHTAKGLVTAAGQIGRKVHREGRLSRSTAYQSCRVYAPATRQDALDEAIRLGYVVPDPASARHVLPGPVVPK